MKIISKHPNNFTDVQILDTKEAFLLTLKNTKRKMLRVPAQQRECTLGVLHGGMRTADVARAINCNVRTVRLLRQCYSEEGWIADCPCSGRPRVSTPAQDRYIRTSEHHTCGTGTGWQQQLPELHQERTIPHQGSDCPQ